MDRTPVSSSNVSSAGYDPDTETLEIEFNNGSVYQYYNVGRNVADEFFNATSKGQFIHTYIRNAYAFSRVA